DVIKAAIDTETAKGNKDNVARLNEMLATLGGSGSETDSLVEAWNTYADNKTPANKAKVFELALAYTKTANNTLADQAYDKAVALAAGDLGAFTTAITNNTLEGIYDASQMTIDKNASALAAKKVSDGATIVSSYNTAVTTYNTKKPAYDKALELVTAYNIWATGRLGAEERLIAAGRAIADTVDEQTITAMTDKGSYTFEVANGAKYDEAWTKADELMKKADVVTGAAITDFNLNPDMVEKYEAELKGRTGEPNDYIISLNSRKALPTLDNSEAGNPVYALATWLGVTFENAKEVTVGSGTKTVYNISGNGFTTNAMVSVRIEICSNELSDITNDSANYLAIVLTPYNVDNTGAYSANTAKEIWIGFKVKAAENPTYTAAFIAHTTASTKLKIENEQGDTTDTAAYTVKFYNAAGTEIEVKTGNLSSGAAEVELTATNLGDQDIRAVVTIGKQEITVNTHIL
ncbi:MAG: hypothetical protein K2O93_08590, partial [Oscillospiraceae bacterium]|nr:hypothetical protein [Oscillospiraceae bacterium]